jgi:hypothetical protein
MLEWVCTGTHRENFCEVGLYLWARVDLLDEDVDVNKLMLILSAHLGPQDCGRQEQEQEQQQQQHHHHHHHQQHQQEEELACAHSIEEHMKSDYRHTS